LIEVEAATSQQLDQAERDVRVLDDQIKAQAQQVEALSRQVAAYGAQVSAVRAQRQTASHQVASASAQVAQIEDRIRRAQVTNPSAGTVLVRYARAGENVQPGQPLYKIADLSAVDVRAYVDETQLSSVKVGQQVQVTFDTAPDQRRSVSGTITSVASQAEFTPTPIQTRDERADLVYAIKVRVANQDDALKIGMPVDVDFGNGR
jgi:HlyD family secretion protein